ncbi:uncharacterized protein B0P05DRAFT_540474 [Gilbertella persicaria]|uniref:uncharacterized protein n=1 Tax=Gilbertella persicaria TaxID=101096 RepID=UPI00221FCB4E|nr:uncharacterized protein B0P05DRAFT_540474 [Gilbertella persicaria]KAI8080226.1 hypothetical protein B0P05DRAFT_540474 [Gilbertella persicaria]
MHTKSLKVVCQFNLNTNTFEISNNNQCILSYTAFGTELQSLEQNNLKSPNFLDFTRNETFSKDF